jgi:hypothetical protein
MREQVTGFRDSCPSWGTAKWAGPLSPEIRANNVLRFRDHILREKWSRLCVEARVAWPYYYGYLLEENEDSELFRYKKVLQRLQDIMKLTVQEHSSILPTLIHFIKASKINLIQKKPGLSGLNMPIEFEGKTQLLGL